MLHHNITGKTLKSLVILALSFTLFNSSQAFFVDPSIKILEKKVHIQVSGTGGMQVDIYEKLVNTSFQDKDIVFTEALPASVQDVRFFVESAGQDFDLLQGQERLETLADLAIEFQEPVFFRMGTESFGTLLKSQEINIPSKEIKHLKLSFTANLDFINDFYFSEIFLDNKKEIKDFELVLNLEKEDVIHHFLNNSPQNVLFEDSEKGMTILWSARDFVPSENFKFLFSQVDNPVLQFPYLGQIYEGHFGTPPSSKEIKEVTILVDKSGSLFGPPWGRIREWLQFLLEEFNDETKIRIGFMGEEIEWYRTEEIDQEIYFHNNFPFRRDFFLFFDRLKPVGEADLRQALESIQEEEQAENKAVLLITDQQQSLFNYEIGIKNPLVLLSFGETGESNLALLSQWSGGFYQKLFHNTDWLIEKEEFLQKWGNLVSSLVPPEELAEIEILPKNFRASSQKGDIFFVGRKVIEEKIPYAKSMNFLPRIWGARRVAELLQKEEFTEENLEALLAIGRTFGVQTEFFNPNTTQKELKKNLGSNPDVRKEVLRLESSGIPEFFPQALNGAVPIYQEKGNEWRSFDFWDKVKTETLLEIAPFSVAQKDLFVSFPDIFAESFGTGEELSFCGEFRCISVEKKKRKYPIWLDRIFWKNFYPYHWANKYLWQLVKEEVLEPEENGDLLPEKEVTRAELANMMYLLQQKKR